MFERLFVILIQKCCATHIDKYVNIYDYMIEPVISALRICQLFIDRLRLVVPVVIKMYPRHCATGRDHTWRSTGH